MPRQPPPGWQLPPSFNLQNAPYTPGWTQGGAASPPPNYQSYSGGAPSPASGVYSAPPSFYNPSYGSYSAYSAEPEPAPESESDYWDMPNPGDWAFPPEGGPGFRWEPTTGQWLPPNFFSDLNWMDYDQPSSGDGEGEPPPWWGQTAPAVPKPVKPKAPGFLSVPGTSPFLEFSDQTLGYGSPAFQQYLPQFLQNEGFTGVGNIGQYGERTYKRPTPYSFTEEDYGAVADPTLRSWLRYFLGGGVLPGV